MNGAIGCPLQQLGSKAFKGKVNGTPAQISLRVQFLPQ